MPLNPNASIEITAYSWVPEFAQGLVRDLRARWALEEAGLAEVPRLEEKLNLLATIARFLDKWLIDGVMVRVSSGLAWGSGFVLRFLQFGNLQGYAFLFGLGAVAVIYLLVFHGGVVK